MEAAKEFLKERVYVTKDGEESVHDSLFNVSETMIDFTRLHVEEALKAVSKIDFDNMPNIKETNDFEEARTITILNVYPLTNII